MRRRVSLANLFGAALLTLTAFAQPAVAAQSSKQLADVIPVPARRRVPGPLGLVPAGSHQVGEQVCRVIEDVRSIRDNLLRARVDGRDAGPIGPG